MNFSLPYHPFVTELEKSDVGQELKYIVRDNQVLAYITGLIYVVLIFSLKTWMKNRKPFTLMVFSILWNFFLFVINSIGFYRALVHTVFVLQTDGFYSSVCNDKIFLEDSVSFFWVVIFPFVKIIELGDTFLIVLQKRFLATFYWTHHLCALIVTWYIFPFYITAAQWLGLLIYFNHIPIYFLATIKAFRIKLPRIFATGLMISEVAHMVSGISLCSAIYYYKVTHRYCDVSLVNNSVLMAAYGMCFVLCACLLYYRFLGGNKNGRNEKIVNDIENCSPEMPKMPM